MKCRKEMEKNSSLTHLDTEDINKEEKRKYKDDESSDFTRSFIIFGTKKKGSEETKEKQQIYEEGLQNKVRTRNEIKSGLILQKNEYTQERPKDISIKENENKGTNQFRDVNTNNTKNKNSEFRNQIQTDVRNERKDIEDRKDVNREDAKDNERNRKMRTQYRNMDKQNNNMIEEKRRNITERKNRVSYRLFINIREKQVDITVTTYLTLAIITIWILTTIYTSLTNRDTFTITTMEGIKYTMPANNYDYRTHEHEIYLLLPINKTKTSERIFTKESERKDNYTQYSRILRYIRIRKDLKELLLLDICDAPLIRWFCMNQMRKKGRRKTN